MTQVARIQGDLFTLDSPLLAGIRGERSLMAYPFFALTKTAWKEALIYRTEAVSIEIGPGPKGVATIYDKEVLLYIASLMIAKLDANEAVTQDFYFTANDLFRATGINGSKRSYTRLAEALERLQGTQIKTNIEAGGEGEEGFFSWLSEARLQYTKTLTGERRLKAVRIRLCDWLFRAIHRDRRVLDYDSAYFQLGPVERRLYEVARSACLDGPVVVDLDELRLQLGYRSSLRQFRHDLKTIAEANTIPGYAFALSEAASPSGPAQRRPSAPTVVTITPVLAIDAN